MKLSEVGEFEGENIVGIMWESVEVGGRLKVGKIVRSEIMGEKVSVGERMNGKMIYGEGGGGGCCV